MPRHQMAEEMAKHVAAEHWGRQPAENETLSNVSIVARKFMAFAQGRAEGNDYQVEAPRGSLTR